MPIIHFALILVAFLVPFVGAVGYIGYEQAKVLVFVLLATAAGVLWLNSGVRPRWGKIERSGVFFILVLLFTSLSGVDIWASLLGRYPYFQGWMVYAYLFLFYLLVGSSNIPLNKWANALVLSSVAVSLFAIKDWIALNALHLSIPTYAGRVVSTFGQPNLYSGFLALSLPFYLYLIKNAEGAKRRLFVLGLIVALLAILVSESRAAILVAAFYFFWIFIVRILKDSRRVLRILGTLAILVISGVLSGAFIFNLLRSEIFVPQDKLWLLRNAPERRSYIWYVVADRILNRPLTGYGLENLQTAFSGYEHKGDTDIMPYSIKTLRVDRAHNYILDILSFSGVLGLLAWGMLLWNLLKSPKPLVLTSTLVLYLLWTQVQIQSVVHLLLFWLVAGLISKGEGNKV